MDRLRTGILGCGSFAHRHAQILAALGDQAEMVAFSDRNEWKARAFADQYTAGQAAVFTDHHALLDAANLDLLIVCLPPYGHTDEVEMAAERGVHLLIEKPIALDSEQGWQMVEAAERAGIKTQVGFMFRFGEAVEQLKTLLASGEVGQPGLMSARYFCNALHADWWRMREKSGGQLVEQIIHMFDLLRYLVGDALTVYSRQENLFHTEVPGYTVEDISATVVGFENGALGVVYATNGAIPGKWINDYRVVAQKLTAEFTDANHATFTFTDAPDRPPQVIASDRDFRRAQMQDLLDAIRTDGQTRTPLREGAKSLDLVLAAMRSGASHGEVTL
ncbi:MAG TPA: Gfo/Idh/MocA family oxidoreductase [Aggregatilinea sp.]|uniref:Gfo/Idh/MocA family protein n=1 Tax=Aggregatilinea sp. TaxID=2806333 RepID=UPI002C6932C2|nr:Gfo/Idh/MocA family oxidoreductase [Aggregatilinea sp.]HML24184.1 Gfo/Idh/MocA family oxidoreductase [Aggregatilinea sp.]